MLESFKRLITYFKAVQIQIRIKKNPDCPILVGTSTYNNLGDHLLSECSVSFLNDCFSDLGHTTIEIPTQVFKRHPIVVSKYITSSTPVFLSAGGWMGNLWPNDDLMLRKMIKAFEKGQVTILPQSIFYTTANGDISADLSNAKTAYSNLSICKIYVREGYSERVGREILGLNSCSLAPDMGLYNIEASPKSYKLTGSKRVLICLRKDRESSGDELRSSVECWANTNGYAISSFDTILDRPVGNKRRAKAIANICKEIAGADLVVTDRLHGMILALRCGCKCIAIDNRTHKVKGVYEDWVSGYNDCTLFDPANENFESALMRVGAANQNERVDWISGINKEFDSMKTHVMRR